MRVLVTGGNGFLGRYVVLALRNRGHDVQILTTGRSGADAFHADLRENWDLGPALAGVDAVVHCAAAMGGGLEEQWKLTVDGTRRLLAAMEVVGLRRMVLLSTFALYDHVAIPEASMLDEDSPLVPSAVASSPYVVAKREQEDLVRAWAGRTGARCTILRPGIVFGPGRTWSYHLGSRLGRLWICTAGASLLPLTYVENCAEAVALAVESEAAGVAVINVVDDDIPSRRGFLEALARRTQPLPRIRDLSWRFLNRLSRIAPLPGLLRRAELHARCKPLRYSNARAKAVLGWRPQWDLAAALERSFAAAPPPGV